MTDPVATHPTKGELELAKDIINRWIDVPGSLTIQHRGNVCLIYKNGNLVQQVKDGGETTITWSRDFMVNAR